MTNEQIKQVALQHGFKLKEQPDGTMDLNPYVYDFARALITNTGSSDEGVESVVIGKHVLPHHQGGDGG